MEAPTRDELTTVCGWHKKHFGKELVLRQGTTDKISHGICLACAKKVQEEMVSRRNYIKNLLVG